MIILRTVLNINGKSLFQLSKNNVFQKINYGIFQRQHFHHRLKINLKETWMTRLNLGTLKAISKQVVQNGIITCKSSSTMIACYSNRLGYILFSFALFKKKTDSSELSKDILANIPKEVFKSEKNVKNKRKHWFIILILRSLLDGLSFCLRLTRIMLTFGPLLCLYPFTYVSKRFSVKWWDWLLTLMEYTGPTFIKLGQWAGTRRDLFSPEFCDMCSRLHNSTKQHAFYITKRKLRKAFGKRWRKIFMKIEKEPIGSGCIAQVHRAYMNTDMIPDESIVEEVLNIEDSDDPEIDFAEGFEIMGFRQVNDYMEAREDRKSELNPEFCNDASKSYTEDKGSSESVIETGNNKILNPDTTNEVPLDSVEIVKQMPENISPIQNENETLIPVAIKVLHPGIFYQVQHDLAILRFWARLLQFFVPSTKWLSVTECMEEFADLMTRQIDLRFEAECLEQFIKNFEDNCNVRFPKPIRPYCKREVLVETLEDGEPISNFLSTRNDTDDFDEVHTDLIIKEKIASIGIDALLQMVFIDNFVHGDLHPGNILVQNANEQMSQDDKLMLVDVGDTVIVTTKTTEIPLRLVLLDTGITTTLDMEDLQNFKNVFTAVVIGDGEKVAELMLKHSRYSECKDVPKFKDELGDIVKTFRKEVLCLGKVQVGDLLTQVFSTCSRHKVKMESNFASILIAIFVLEGLGRSLDPEMDILERAKPILLG